MKDFVFIIPLTPSIHKTPLRQDLFELMLSSLTKQTSNNWQAILVGEYEKTEGNFIYIPAKAIEPGFVKKIRSTESATDKHFKIEVALQNIAAQPRKPKYLIRLDDDDIFSPTILSKVQNLEYDCCVDRYHTYYDVSTGKICQNAATWFPNTIIHKYEHAIAPIPAGSSIDEPGGPLIAWSHNVAFHKYYEEKNVIFADKNHPVYLRTITPTSVSFAGQKDKLQYEEYISRYGEWYYKRLEDFEVYITELIKLAEKYFGIKINRDTGKTRMLKDWMGNKIRKYKKRLILSK